MQFIVLEDPLRVYLPGTILEPEQAHASTAKGTVCLPIEQILFDRGALGGFFRRDWGQGRIAPSVPGPCAPLVMHVVPTMHKLWWAAKLEGSPRLIAEMRAGEQAIGQLRVVGDSGQSDVIACGLSNDGGSVIDLSSLDINEASGVTPSWVVQGTARLHVPNSGFMGFMLYGHAREMRILWTAISLTE